MIDIDAVLTSDAEEWNRRQVPAPDLAACVARSVAAGRDVRRRRAAAIAAAVTAAAAVTVGVVTLRGQDHDRGPAPQRGDPPASITVDGKSLPNVGDVPWSSPVADADNPRVVFVYADGDEIHSNGTFSCGLPHERPVARETSSTVTVLVAGYDQPLPPGAACGGVGHLPQRVRVTLDAPLGSRALLDATTGRRHRALDPRTVPNLASVPAGYRALPITWTERTGVATRVFTGPAAGPASATGISLRYQPPRAHAAPRNAQDPDGETSAVTVAGRRAELYTFTEQRGGDSYRRYTLVWDRADHSRVTLAADGPARAVLSPSQLIALADHLTG